MSDIKVIEGLPEWEVMKRASEGEDLWVTDKGKPPFTGWPCNDLSAVWNWEKRDYHIIDTSAPDYQWDKVNWDFFNQYGGLPVINLGEHKVLITWRLNLPISI